MVSIKLGTWTYIDMFVHNNHLYLIITVSNADLALSGLKLEQFWVPWFSCRSIPEYSTMRNLVWANQNIRGTDRFLDRTQSRWI